MEIVFRYFLSRWQQPEWESLMALALQKCILTNSAKSFGKTQKKNTFYMKIRRNSKERKKLTFSVSWHGIFLAWNDVHLCFFFLYSSLREIWYLTLRRDGIILPSGQSETPAHPRGTSEYWKTWAEAEAPWGHKSLCGRSTS